MALKKPRYLDTSLVFNAHLQTVTNATIYNESGFSVLKPPKYFNAFMGNFTHILVEQLDYINYYKDYLEKMKTTKAAIENELKQ